jgi:hypothetical protein
MKKSTEKIIVWSILGLLIALPFWRWFFTDWLLTQGDWVLIDPITLGHYLNVPFAWNWTGLGSANITASYYPTYLLQAILAHIELGYPLIERLVFFFPAVLCLVLGTYFYVRHVFKSHTAGIIAAAIYTLNTYTLITINNHVNIVSAMALMPLVLLCYEKLFATRQVRYSIIAGLLLFLISAYDFRILYIFLFVLAPYVVIRGYNKKGIFYIATQYKESFLYATPIFLALLTNMYWVVGIINMQALTDNELFSRGLFGNAFYSTLHSLTLHHPFWTGSHVEVFTQQPIPYYFFAVPLIAVISLLTSRQRPLVFFFGIVTLIGILLSKQVDLPFPSLYPFLYEHFPGFNAFREASKFYTLIALGYALVLGGLFAGWTTEQRAIVRNVKLTSAAVVMSVVMINAIPAMNGNLDFLFQERVPHTDYAVLNDHFNSVNGPTTTLWVPRDSRYAVYTPVLRKVSLTYIERETTRKWRTQTPGTTDDSPESRLAHTLNTEYFSDLLSGINAHYVIVPIRDTINNDDFFKHYGGQDNTEIREWYIAQIDALPYLERIDIGAEELVIYENKNYLPHIRSTTALTSYADYSSIEEKYLFASSKLALPFDFFTAKESKSFPSYHITQLYDDLDQNSFVDNELRTVQSTKKSATVYARTTPQYKAYRTDKENLIVINQYVPGLYHASLPLYEHFTSPSSKHIYPQADVAISSSHVEHLSTSTNWLVLGRINLEHALYTTISSGVLQNGSFEEGLWQKQVGDCNNYDENPLLDMRQTSEAYEGTNALELSATRHIACTKTSAPVTASSTYILSLAYQGKNAKQAGYYLSFNNGTSSDNISERLPITSENWQVHEKLVNIPNNTSELTIHLYAYETDGLTENTVHYDAVSLQEIEYVATIPAATSTPQYEEIPLPQQDEYEFTFSDPNYNLANNIPNPSLEEGLWQSKVGDCNNYDSYGRLDMRHATMGSEGQLALELSATRHIACTGPGLVPVAGGGRYLLSFDYQSENAKQVGYYIGFNNDAGSVSERIQLSDADRGKEWHTFTKQIDIPADATTASLLVYAYESDGKTENIVRYDNFHLIELPPIHNRYYLVSDPQTNFVDPESITFDLVNPTKKLVHIKGATTPFYLAMSESYHPEWQAQFTNDKIQGFFNGWVPFVTPDTISDDHHFELNGLLNGWYIDIDEHCKQKNLCTQNPDGSYDIELTLEFFPQRWFYLGLLISGTTLIGCVGYLVYDFACRRRRHAKHSV